MTRHPDHGNEAMTTALMHAKPLPIEAYDDLRASEILPLLAELSHDELAAVRRHECDRKARTTVLDRIDALRARQQIPQPRISPEDYPLHDPRTWQSLLDPDFDPHAPEWDHTGASGLAARLGALLPRRHQRRH